VTKAAGSKAKTNGRSKKTGSPSRAAAQRAPRARASSAAAKPRRQRSASARSRSSQQPPRAYSGDDRKALLLLLAPFALMAVAVGAAHTLGPDSVRRQLARLPGPLPVLATSAAPHELVGAPPRTLAASTASIAEIVSKPVRETVGAVAQEAKVETLPPPDKVAVRIARESRAGRCVATTASLAKPKLTPMTPATAAASPSVFGGMLARAARAQTGDLVIYTDRYRQIGFPNGDVSPFYGVCTDVVIRAYRALGIDLQVLVHNARVGTGDTSIDHRRTKTLRRFFERYGESIPITDFPEDYLPGDIVTYYRASGRTSQTHIAIVSDVIAPSGRPMIVHNRGWGPQLEDALFASSVTGHYRFNHSSPAEQASAPEATQGSALR
jgi:uncharacterized protein YijF (DUF1287 family)